MPVAVVTGASRGLGRQIALSLGKAGYYVAVNYKESVKEAEEVARLAGENSVAIRADVGILNDVEVMAKEIYRRWGRVDALINNAGITRDGLLVRYSEEDWDEVMRVNIKGCFNTVKSFAPLMMKSGGHIINISSRSLRGRIGQAAYGASKASMLGLTVALAGELAEYNIRVNSILPGYMITEMGVGASAAMAKAKEESVMGRLSSVDEVSDFIVAFLSTRNITGQTFSLDSRI